MNANEIKTWSDVGDYLMERMDQATEKISNVNQTLTKNQVWGMTMGWATTYAGNEIEPKTKEHLIKNLITDFGE